MSSDLAHIRALLGNVNTGAITLAANLLNAVISARDILANLADDNVDAAIAFQILADAAAEAAPPPACSPKP